MVKTLYPVRFELFLITQLLILFGSLIVPSTIFGSINPFLFLVNLATGVVFVSKDKWVYKFLIGLLILSSIILLILFFSQTFQYELIILRLICFFIFYAIVTLEIIKQVASFSVHKKKAILGLMSGYISIGLLAFFMFTLIEYVEPNSFANLQAAKNITIIDLERLLYFSYVTLLTIGYGEIYPISSLAQKGSILVALLGQFYFVILTAIVVGKYLNQKI